MPFPFEVSFAEIRADPDAYVDAVFGALQSEFFIGRIRTVTVSGADGRDVPRGTLGAIKRQSGLPRRLFRQG